MRHLLALCLAMTAWLSCLPAYGLDRPLRHVVAAIHQVEPRLNPNTARAWAKVIRSEAISRSFDPLTLISIVRFESKFNPGVVNNNPPIEYSVGLVQVNVLSLNGPCQGVELLPTARCQAMIGRLQDGSYNLRYGAQLITRWRKLCRTRTGRPALFARWLSGFQGYNRRRGVMCNQRQDARGRWRDLPVPEKTRLVMRYRLQLIRALGLGRSG